MHAFRAYSMLADRLERCNTGTGDKPCTFQLPQMSRQILRCKLIMFGICSMRCAVHEDQRKAKRQKADGETYQDGESPKELKRRWAHATDLESVSGDIQERHSQAPLLTGRGEPNKKQRSNKFSTGNARPLYKELIKWTGLSRPRHRSRRKRLPLRRLERLSLERATNADSAPRVFIAGSAPWSRWGARRGAQASRIAARSHRVGSGLAGADPNGLINR